MLMQNGQNKPNVLFDGSGVNGCFRCGHCVIYDVDGVESAIAAKSKIVCEIYGITSSERASVCKDLKLSK